MKRTGKLLGCSGARYYAFQESEGVWPVRWRDDRGVEHEDSTYPDAQGAAARVAVLNGEAYKTEAVPGTPVETRRSAARMMPARMGPYWYCYLGTDGNWKICHCGDILADRVILETPEMWYALAFVASSNHEPPPSSAAVDGNRDYAAALPRLAEHESRPKQGVLL